MLTDAELTQLRADMLPMLTDTCNIERNTGGSVDAYGALVENWTTVGTAVACRVDPYKRDDSKGEAAGREANRSYFRVTLKWDADITDGDRLLWQGDRLEVMQLHQTHSERTVTRAMCGRIS